MSLIYILILLYGLVNPAGKDGGRCHDKNM
jgi:hypothetical protein